MDKLLTAVLDAHGGLQNWAEVTTPDVTGNPLVAHYTRNHKTFDGFVFPTRRLVHLHDASGIANQGFAPITIDVAAVTLDRG